MKILRTQKFFKRRLAIPWLLLKRYPFRLLTATAGIAFAGLLVLMQLSIQEALYKSSTSLIEKLNADIVMVSPGTTSMISLSDFPADRIPIAYSSSAVEQANPLSKHTIRWRNPGSSQTRYLMAVGINPSKKIFDDEQINKNQTELLKDGRVLLDEYSRPEFGVDLAKKALNGNRNATFFAGIHRLNVVGFFKLGSSFAYESTLITSSNTLNSMLPKLDGYASLGVIKLKEGSNIEETIRFLSNIMPEDVVLLTKEEFVQVERKFWSQDKPIGLIFLFCSIMGLAVGAIMVYQTLSTDVANYIESYAVMMCYGYTRSDLEGLVLIEGAILSVLAFPISFTASAILCYILGQTTRLPFSLSWITVGGTFFMMVLISYAAGLFAMARIREADPSELFS